MIPTLTVDIKRVGETVAGWEPLPVVVYSGVSCLELYPIDAHLRAKLPVKPMANILQTITYDVITVYPNDIVSVSGVGEYPIISVEKWFARVVDKTYLVLTMESPVEV